MSTHSEKRTDPWSPKKHILIGVLTLALLVGGVGGWSAFAQLAGAVIASGELRVESNRQVVQHPDGGVVADILIKDGDRVSAGDVLFRLDDTRQRAELGIIDVQLDEARATTARLIAERDGSAEMLFPRELKERAASDQRLQSVLQGQKKLHAARIRSLDAEKTQLSRQIEQARERIVGASAQIAALETQTALANEERDAQQKLFDKGLATAAPLMALKRDVARLSGEIAALRSSIAEAESEIAAFEVERLQLDGDRREQAIGELRELDAKIAELGQQRIVIADQLTRMDMRAPRSGVVHALAVHARQAVIQPAEALLYLVPEDEALIIDVQVAPTEIDAVYLGQPVDLRFPAANMRTTPSIPGRVETISADRSVNEESGERFFTVEVALADGSLQDVASEFRLLPGMPVEAHIQTESRTPISYLVKPLSDQVARALREE